MSGAAGDVPRAPRRVAVCGSCITRDNFNARFNPDHRRWYDVVAQANQSSMIALMSPPVVPEVTDQDGLSAYDAWNVRSDLSRSFLTEVVEAAPDYLVLDFFGDLHFGVRRLPDGRYVTDNSWKLHKTAQFARWNAEAAPEVHRPLADPEQYFALWAEAMDRFAIHVAEHLPSTTVVVHRGFYADRVVTGPTGRPRSLRRFAGLPALKVRRLNEFWARLDDHAITTYGWESIDLTRGRYTSVADHPWGAFWVHYSPDYYHRFLAELHALDLARRLQDPAASAAVAQISDAGRERIEVQEVFVRAAVRAQRDQVRALEERGALAAGRAAMRRRRAAR